MSYFTKFRPYYYIPERLSPQEIASRRVERLVGLAHKEIERQDALQDIRRARLYPDEARIFEQRKRVLREAIASHSEAVEPLRPVRNANRALYAAIAGHLQRQRLAGQPLPRALYERAKAQAAASGKYYDPASAAKYMQPPYRSALDAHVHKLVSRLLPKLSGHLLPCIERSTRREVLFARGHGGKGHRVSHRFTPRSLVRC